MPSVPGYHNQQSDHHMAAETEPIAIIGMSFKFPKDIESSDAFLKALLVGENLATEYPEDRLNIDSFWHPSGKRNTIAARKAHFLGSDIRNFDAGFFAMAPHEVIAMDPQQRALMEATYHAIENAGLSLKDVSGTKTSVHVGSFAHDFAQMQSRDTQSMPKYNAIGTASSILANRISYFFNLKGESIFVDTACSSSLVATALGCQAIYSGSDMAIVAAANIILGPEFGISLSNLNFLSPSGTSRSFDAKGDGYGRGEGFASLLLKPVSKAIRDGNPVRAVIRSIGMNQDGFTPGGLTQPSKDMQLQLIRETYKKAELDMAYTRFFESHGTGTFIGDPIEASAIGEAFQEYRSASSPMYVGALKSMIGHLEGASGLAAIVKTVICLEEGIIPPNANFDELNPRIDAVGLKLHFPTQSIPWPKDETRRASVNSFGFGGTNVHVVLDSAMDYLQAAGYNYGSKTLRLSCMVKSNGIASVDGHRDKVANSGDLVPVNVAPSCTSRILAICSSDEEGVARITQSISAYLSHRRTHLNAEALEDVLYTLNLRQLPQSWRAYSIIESSQDLIELGSRSLTSRRSINISTPRLGFVFTGQGAQYPNMALEILTWPKVIESLARSQSFLEDLGCRWNIMEELSASPAQSRINKPEFSQTLTTIVQIALIEVTRVCHIQPQVVVGHSSGEIAAAYCAGYLSHESAVRVAYFRGVLADRVSCSSSEKQGMIAVQISSNAVTEELTKFSETSIDFFDTSKITISCINSPNNVTLSGPSVQLDQLLSHFSKNGRFTRRLNVDLAYHSPQMEKISHEYASHLINLTPDTNFGLTMMVSSVTAHPIKPQDVCTPMYWVKNMISPVKFEQAVRLAATLDCSSSVAPKSDSTGKIFTGNWLEVGPHSALRGPIREVFESNDATDFFYAPLLARNVAADKTLLEAAGELYCRDIQIDLQAINSLSTSPTRVPRFALDLPPYPFNHSVIHWQESSRSRSYRFRPFGHNALLGEPSLDWNENNALWRLQIKEETMPWIAEHQIDGQIWYPAAGMIALAIEAINQLMSKQKPCPVGFEIHDIRFLAPIVLNSSSASLDLQTSLVAVAGAGTKDAQYKFNIYSRLPDAIWQIACDGLIRADFAHRDTQFTMKEMMYTRQRTEEELQIALKACRRSIDTQDMYQKIHESTALQYGPVFQPLSDIHYNMDGRAIASILPHADLTESPATYVIHPATLDGIFQLTIPALSRGLTVGLPTLVPSRISRIWISRQGAGKESCAQEIAHSQARFLSKVCAESSTVVYSCSANEVRVEIDQLEVTQVASDEKDTQTEAGPQPLCYGIFWKPDIALLDNTGIHNYCSHNVGFEQEPEKFFDDIRLMISCFAAKALETIKSERRRIHPSLTRYATWLQARVDHYSHLGRLPDPDALMSKTTLDDGSGSRKTTDILVGDLDPLSLLFKDDHFVASFYEELNNQGRAYKLLDSYLDILVHKSPNLTFLEIGAGAGASTSLILDILASSEHGPRYSSYTFTDISGFFFQKAKDRFATRSDRLKYQVLDIEQNPASQGFEELYDVVVAANGLHATRDLDQTLQNVKSLLKPGGKLIIMEMTTPNKIETGFVFGTLPGWWLGANGSRKSSAIIDEDQWDLLLKKNGFSGLEQVYQDWESPQCHLYSIMISSPETLISPNTALPPFHSTTILLSKSAMIEEQIAEKFKSSSSNHGSSSGSVATVAYYEDILELEDLAHRDFLIFGSPGQKSLSDIAQGDFEALQRVLTGSKSVIWTESYDAGEDAPPYWAMIDGLVRTCRSEDLSRPIVTLLLETNTWEAPASAVEIIQKVQVATHAGLIDGSYEEEYREVSGRLCVSRLAQAKKVDEYVWNSLRRVVQMQDFESSPPLQLSIRTPGLLDSLEWVEDEVAYNGLKPNEIEVKVKAIGINFKECLVLLGRVNTDRLGGECSGHVHRIGSAVRKFQVGDRVATGALETYKTYVRVADFQAVKLPDKMSFVDGAAIPTAFYTAWHSLVKVGRLQKGETVLIHAAAGGTGQAAVQVAKYIGAQIFATVSTEAKKKVLIDRYGLHEDHIFSSRDVSFTDGIRRITKNRGIDVILNSLSGRLLVASWELIAPFGRFVEIGRKDVDSRGSLPMFPFIRNATFSCVDLTAIVQNENLHDGEILEKVMELISSGVLMPSYPVHPFPVEQAEQAFRLLQSGQSTGKIVLDIPENAQVLVRASPVTPYRLHTDATYVISGGLGGIGRQVARWLVRHGAKHLLLLSRSGIGHNSDKKQLVHELEEKGVNVNCIPCDITDLESVRTIFAEAAVSLPPIRGCIQAAMILSDRPFSTMQLAEWNEGVRTKVSGSWNLHATLPSGIDFFVMLSSTAGVIGNASQSNYAAGNTFQDELARHRVSRGEKAIAIDLGMIIGEGIVAENKEIQKLLSRLDILRALKQEEVFAILDYSCHPVHQPTSAARSQIVCGLEIPANIRRKGRELPPKLSRSLFRAFHQIRSVNENENETVMAAQAQDMTAVLSEASSIEEAEILVAESIKAKVCKIVGMKEEEKSIHDTMRSFGVDSLIALELRNWLARELRVDMAIHDIVGDFRLVEVGALVAKKAISLSEPV
ncbi:reducing type I polyketide synthase [Pseudovirgaria hyperparasitica]|uniref:Reducing type I polyketide synthase n=1 Tax=Pseudovirgaria hyperparasitica TaxID=470096 RepID=A0A6A6VRJ1_9PEZI|nr:reducing type I polyketide synthase [Pseudovirgaria hyperparasitica]KAF2752775.1 reducing type I polyketide synthase [Pseudovirgaria hyperparasitica]